MRTSESITKLAEAVVAADSVAGGSANEGQRLAGGAEVMERADHVKHLTGSAPVDLACAIDLTGDKRVKQQNLLPGRRKAGAEDHSVCSPKRGDEARHPPC